MMDALNVTTVLLAAVTCVTILAGSWYLIHTRDPYKHLNRTQNQNKENSDADQVKWMNMGWWTVSDGHKQPTFHQACEALAQQVYTFANIQPRQKILDVGHGDGDSLLLLAKQYNPSLLVGITLSQSEALAARRRLHAFEIATAPPFPFRTTKETYRELYVYRADALAFLATQRTTAYYDTIICLDCAYHFRPSRLEFFTEAYRHLNPRGGKLVLYDMVKSSMTSAARAPWYTSESTLPPRTELPTLWQKIRLSLLLHLSASKLVDVDAYHHFLTQAGFSSDNINMKDVSSHVFPGFARFLSTYEDGDGDGSDVPLGNSWAVKSALSSFGAVVSKWAQGGNQADVQGVLVLATRNDET